jgi:dTDP-glucose 4,6-dehydratase
MKALVTGSRGFIGSHVTKFVMEKGWEVSHYHDDYSVDVIFSIASGADVQESILRPKSFIQNNVNLMIDLLEDARRMEKLKQIIHLSTAEVYGPSHLRMGVREWGAISPHSPYSASKAAQEAIAMAYWKSYCVPVTIVNTQNVFGEKQQKSKFIPATVKAIMNDEEVVIHGSKDEPTIRPYIHADVLADALVWLAERQPEQGPNHCPRYNVVGEEKVTMLQLAQMIAMIMGKKLRYRFEAPKRPGHGGTYCLNGDKIADFGWSHPIGFRKTLHSTVLRLMGTL